MAVLVECRPGGGGGGVPTLGIRRRRRGKSTKVAEGGGGGGSSGQHIAADDPMVGASAEGVGGGGGGRVVRTPTAATPEDGGLHLGAEGGEEGSDEILPAAAAIESDTAARTVEERQCQVAADGSGQDGAGESSSDKALVSLKGSCFPNEVLIQLPTLRVRICTTEPAHGSADLLL